MPSRNRQTKAGRGSLKLTSNGVIRFHGKSNEGYLLGFIGVFAPQLNGTMEIVVDFHTHSGSKDGLPGPHTFEGYVGPNDLVIKLSDAALNVTGGNGVWPWPGGGGDNGDGCGYGGMTLCGRVDPPIGRRINIEGSGSGSVGWGTNRDRDPCEPRWQPHRSITVNLNFGDCPCSDAGAWHSENESHPGRRF